MGHGHILVDAIEEKCVLVGVISSKITDAQAGEFIDELQFLAETAGAITERKFLQKLPIPNPKTYVGSGKLEEITEFVKNNDIDVVIFDDELSPSQLRNIERFVGVKILDRNNLILDIFASRARTSHANTSFLPLKVSPHPCQSRQ